jgi:hypothetical protein
MHMEGMKVVLVAVRVGEMMALRDWGVTCCWAVREGVGAVRDQVRICLKLGEGGRVVR